MAVIVGTNEKWRGIDPVSDFNWREWFVAFRAISPSDSEPTPLQSANIFNALARERRHDPQAQSFMGDILGFEFNIKDGLWAASFHVTTPENLAAFEDHHDMNEIDKQQLRIDAALRLGVDATLSAMGMAGHDVTCIRAGTPNVIPLNTDTTDIYQVELLLNPQDNYVYYEETLEAAVHNAVDEQIELREIAGN